MLIGLQHGGVRFAVRFIFAALVPFFAAVRSFDTPSDPTLLARACCTVLLTYALPSRWLEASCRFPCITSQKFVHHEQGKFTRSYLYHPKLATARSLTFDRLERPTLCQTPPLPQSNAHPDTHRLTQMWSSVTNNSRTGTDCLGNPMCLSHFAVMEVEGCAT